MGQRDADHPGFGSAPSAAGPLTDEVLARLARELRAISSCHQVLLRASEEQKLLHDICRIICDEAGHRLAWVGYAEQDEARTIRPVAWAGFDSGYIAEARLTWADTERGRGPSGTAIRSGQTVYVQDLEHSPAFAPWLGSALQRGYHASIALPLKDEAGKVLGVLNIYSGETHAFPPDEQRLLEELAGDLAFGLTVLRARAERRRAEEDRAAREREYRALAEISPDNILRYDRDCRILYANQQARATLARSGIEPLGKTPLELTPEGLYEGGRPEVEHFQRTLRRVIATGEGADLEMHALAPSGRTQIHAVRFAAERDTEGRIVGALAFGRDITEQRRLEEQLSQAQKMEAVGQLAGGVAHDFNNILTAIIGFGNLAKMRMKPDDPQAALIDQILAASDRAAGLTRSLLAFSRRQVLVPSPVEVNSLLTGVVKLLGRLIGEDIELTTRLDPQGLIVMADAGQIEQVLMNLATNARDAMPSGGSLVLTTEARTLGDDFIRAHGYGRRGRYALITVSDTGTGMPEATRKRIFEPFFTTKPKGKGTGLGLSMAYGIVKQHEGFINVYSEPGQGTTFRIYLPVVAMGAEEPQPEEPPPPARGTETLLVAEDDPAIRGLTTTVLEDFGYRVLAAVDGQDALEQFTAHADEIDLVILDVVMPKLGGKEVYDAVKRLRPGAKTLFTSGYTADLVQKKGIFQEGAQFIAKPVSPSELLRKIRWVLDGGEGTPPG